MLKYSYSLNISSNEKELFLDDLYISQDLSLISGTTTTVNCCKVGESLTVRSTYFVNDLTVNVLSKTRVKRNGYIYVPLILPVHTAKIVDDNGDLVTMKYVENNGNTYYSYVGEDVFLINGIEYSATDVSTLEIMNRVYVEDDKVVVDGIKYNVTINNNSQVLFNDQSGEPFLLYQSWDISNVTSASTYVDKLLIGNSFNDIIECNSVTFYGHMAYTVYAGEKYYIEYFKDNSGSTIGCGITIDGNRSFLTEDPQFNIYNINDYYALANTNANDETNDVTPETVPQIEINGVMSFIYFEPCQILGSGILCVETKVSNLPILLNDRITIKSTNPSTEVVVKYVDDSNGYVYFNGRKYDVIKNLCDSVNLGGRDFILTIESAGTESNIESTTMPDGSKMYFDVSVISDNGGTRKVARKVEFVNNKWEFINTVQFSAGTENVIYGTSAQISVDEHDGVQLDGYKSMVMHYENTYEHGDTGNSVNSYDYIVTNTPQEYRLVVINTVGNNKFLCVPDINPYLYGENGAEEMKYDTMSSIVGNDFIVQKRDNKFGIKDLYFDTWLKDAYDISGGTSVYELYSMSGDIAIFLRNTYFELPITLSNVISNKSRYDELVIANYYPIEEEKAINRLVDMEKDMYTPVFLHSGIDEILPVKSMSFNLHFRTRELDTWKVIEDEGEFDAVGQGGNYKLSANYQYCNYFITDYYPYHNYFNDTEFDGEKFSKLLSNSDLLGFLWFTTDDVKRGAEKIKKSFLRLTFFDSKNPEKQNMLGTSTLYFDCDRYFNVINRTFDKEEKKFHYELTAKSWQKDRSGNDTDQDVIPVYGVSEPGVTKECFYLNEDGTTHLDDLAVGDYKFKLDSTIVVNDRYENVFPSSEGFYAYILKEFSNKRKKQTIYMKAEFFHAGIGVKIPMAIPTRMGQNNEYVAIQNSEWTESVYNEFIDGYELNSVFDRLYIPITIEYSTKYRKFIYMIGDDGGYSNAIGSRYVYFTTEDGRYNTQTGEKEPNTINYYFRRTPDKLTAPIKVRSLNDDYVFAIYRYNLDGTYVKPYYWDMTYIELDDTNYKYSIAFSNKNKNVQISENDVQNNYIIENTNKDWVFNLFELKIKPQ